MSIQIQWLIWTPVGNKNINGVSKCIAREKLFLLGKDKVFLLERYPRFNGVLAEVPLYLSLSHRPDLGRSLNTDEAAALGAVYQAAGQTKLFRVKKFIVKDANVLPIVVRRQEFYLFQLTFMTWNFYLNFRDVLADRSCCLPAYT